MQQPVAQGSSRRSEGAKKWRHPGPGEFVSTQSGDCAAERGHGAICFQMSVQTGFASSRPASHRRCKPSHAGRCHQTDACRCTGDPSPIAPTAPSGLHRKSRLMAGDALKGVLDPFPSGAVVDRCGERTFALPLVDDSLRIVVRRVLEHRSVGRNGRRGEGCRLLT